MKLDVDLECLRLFKTPMTAYTLHKRLTCAYSWAHTLIQRFRTLGLVEFSESKQTEKNRMKNYYIISERGKKLIALFKDLETTQK